MAGIPEYIIDQVRERTDIAEVISHYIPLKKAGRNYRALCPFHHEKTPSFMVSPSKQIYHCFGCGAGGNVFNFLMKYERLEFPEAVRELAKNAGVVVPEISNASGEKGSLAEKLHAISEMAARFFAENLLKKESPSLSRQYLKERRIDPQTVDKFQIGYAPKSWNSLLGHLREKGYDESLLEKSGLVIRGKDGRLFDRFRDRIIFPISDTKGRIKGFGSRVLTDEQPKYMNSPDTFIYNKGNHLYGLNLTWEEIRNKNAAVVVEGYLDLLTPYQHGIRNMVASLGTALTTDQIRLLKRYTNNIIILFDADQAGENATIRSLDLLVEEDLKAKVVQLPKGYDPDSFINKYGGGSFRKVLDSAQDLFDYKFNLLMKRYDAKNLEGKAQIVDEMLPLISKIKNAILQSGYLKRLADMLSVDEADLKRELLKVKPDYTYHYKPDVREAKDIKSNMAERILAGLMLEDDSFIKSVKESLNCDDFRDLSIKKIVAKLFEYYDAGRNISPSKLIDCFKEDEGLCASISELTATCENLVDRKKSLKDCIQRMRECALKERLKALCEEIRLAQDRGDDSKVISLITKYNDLMKEVKV